MSIETNKILHERFTAPAENYQIINENQIVGNQRQIWDADWSRERHLQDVDRLVGIFDGSISEKRKRDDYRNIELSHQAPDVIIALDKSARPAIDMVNAFWDDFSRNDAKMPQVDYLNIDRMDWLQLMGYSKQDADSSKYKAIDFDAVSDDQIARIRAYFVEGDITEDNWREEVWNLPTRLDNKKLMVLDEVQNSGATLEIAVGLMRRAIPEAAVVTGEVFWTDEDYVQVNGESQRLTAPVWYDRNTDMGRGIGDVSAAYHDYQYEKDPSQENLKRKIAAHVLSAPHHNKQTYEELDDDLYKKLQQDIAYMTYDYANGKILRMPDSSRGDDWEEIIRSQGLDVREYVDYINARKQKQQKKMINAGIKRS